MSKLELKRYLLIAKIRKINQAIVGTVLCLMISLIISIVISFWSLIFWPDILLSVLFWLFLGVSFAYSFTDDPMDLIKPGITIIGNFLFILMIFFLAIFPGWSFVRILPIAYVISMVLFIGLCIGFVLTIFANSYDLYYWIKNRKSESRIKNIYQTGKVKKILFIGSITLLCPIVLFAVPGIIEIPITIHPKDYNANISVWGGFDNYSTSVKESLNKHHVIVGQCCLPDIMDDEGEEKAIKMYTYYNNSYPDISFLISVYGVPGAFVWDGNIKNAVKYAKKVVSIAQENNLTNIKGLVFDIEGPWTPYLGFWPEDYDPTPDRERHDESLEVWEAFFDWMKKSAPEMELSAVNYVESGIDTFDGDSDLHYIRRYSFMDFDKEVFDEYAPMSYRCMYGGTKPEGDGMENPLIRYLDGGHYWLYSQMDLLAKALDEKYGEHDKMGVYLGITGCTCYKKSSPQYLDGKEEGDGYDSLVRDALIAKHFGVPRITLFLLNTVTENGYYMYGIFDSYGADFLDKFMDDINGKDSITSFKIYYKPRFNFLLCHGQVDNFIFDIYANLNSILGIFYISALTGANALVAYYGLTKIKKSAERSDAFRKNNLKS